MVIKDLVRVAYLKVKVREGPKMEEEEAEPPSLANRVFGYSWVAAFMTWSGSVWLYPQASRPASPGTNNSFFPHNIGKAWKTGNFRAG